MVASAQAEVFLWVILWISARIGERFDVRVLSLLLQHVEAVLQGIARAVDLQSHDVVAELQLCRSAIL